MAGQQFTNQVVGIQHRLAHIPFKAAARFEKQDAPVVIEKERFFKIDTLTMFLPQLLAMRLSALIVSDSIPE